MLSQRQNHRQSWLSFLHESSESLLNPFTPIPSVPWPGWAITELTC